MLAKLPVSVDKSRNLCSVILLGLVVKGIENTMLTGDFLQPYSNLNVRFAARTYMNTKLSNKYHVSVSSSGFTDSKIIHR
jgi:hypothetical protein